MQEVLTKRNYLSARWPAYFSARTTQPELWEKVLPKVQAAMLDRAQKGAGIDQADFCKAARQQLERQTANPLGPHLTSLWLVMQFVSQDKIGLAPLGSGVGPGQQIDGYKAAINFFRSRNQLCRLDKGRNPLQLTTRLFQQRRFLVALTAMTRWYDYIILPFASPTQEKFVLAYEATDPRLQIYSLGYFLSFVVGTVNPGWRDFSLYESCNL